MKKIIISFAAIILSLIVGVTKADSPAAICQDDPNEHFVQCTYLTDSNVRHWIKIEMGGQSFVGCEGSLQTFGDTISVTPIQMIQTASEPTVVSICKDGSGSGCQMLANFTMSCDSKTGTCTPVLVPISLKAFDNSFPSCNQSASPMYHAGTYLFKKK